MARPRALDWVTDDDGTVTALNPYAGEPDTADYATRYLVRQSGTGWMVIGEMAGTQTAIGTFDELDAAKAAAQSDADMAAGADED